MTKEEEIDCKNPKKVDFTTCDSKFPFMSDYLYQDQCIEHEDYWTPVFFYNEAVGDIFRELSHGWNLKSGFWFDKGYIKEKLRKLKTINELNESDVIEKEKHMGEKEIKILKTFEKKVNDWMQFTDPNYIDKKTLKRSKKNITPFCDDLINIKKTQISSVRSIKNLIKWGLGEKDLLEIQNDLNDYVNIVKNRLDIK